MMESPPESALWEDADGHCHWPVSLSRRRRTLVRPVIYYRGMWGKNLLFYFVTSTVMYYVAAALGASFVVAVLASMIGPAVILLVVQIIRWNEWL